MTKNEMLEKLQVEPEYTEGEYKGYIYEIKRSDALKTYCGYVYVPNSTFESNKNLFELDRIFCHGGITYYDDEKIGFDTAHWNDLIPIFVLDGISEFGEYRDINFCENECKSIIEQLIEIHNSYKVIPLKK